MLAGLIGKSSMLFCRLLSSQYKQNESPNTQLQAPYLSTNSDAIIWYVFQEKYILTRQGNSRLNLYFFQDDVMESILSRILGFDKFFN